MSLLETVVDSNRSQEVKLNKKVNNNNIVRVFRIFVESLVKLKLQTFGLILGKSFYF